MERLTYRLNDQCDNPTDSIILKPYLRYEDPETRKKILNRLAAYEELMERWKLRSIEEADRIFQRVNALGGTDLMAQYRAIGSIDHLRDLLQAEQDGRLVVLPCKVGDTALVKDRAGVLREMRLDAPDIRFICTDEDNFCGATCNRKPDGFCAYRIRNDGSDIGKTVFLTRGEAEAALAGKG